jgi:hypothetical protein
MDDLQAIPFSQAGFSPPITGDDAPVQFDGYPIGLHRQLINETGKG